MIFLRELVCTSEGLEEDNSNNEGLTSQEKRELVTQHNKDLVN